MRLWFHRPKIAPAPAETVELKKACLTVAGHLRAAGYDTPAFSSDTRDLPENFRDRLNELKIYAELLDTMVKDGLSPKGHKDLLWKYLAYKRYVPTSDILDLIEDEDMIEIYNMENYQIFRNLNYFSVTSMSVEDLVSVNWKREFKRSSKITLSLVELVLRFATGFFRSTYDCAKIPVHHVQELSL